MSDTKPQNDQNKNDATELPWGTFLMRMILGQWPATPPDKIPLPAGRLEDIAKWATQGNAADTSEQIMNRSNQTLDPYGQMRTLTPEERALLDILINGRR